ncbi:hypothetical protein BGW41_003943 [Actinomortierella wolfii]|nr:hypothetical protein BGW41_003943 [Actinomortierella wolfii]
MDSTISHLEIMTTNDISNSSFKVGKRIGEGTYGIVYKGEYKTLKAAIKKFHLTACTRSRAAIENEIRLLEQLRCRNIIQFFGAMRRDHEIWLITDYAERGSLKRAIDKALLVGWDVKQRIAQEIANGLAYIHHENILHRDLKSANVLLTKSMEVKLCDFGLAVVKEHSELPVTGELQGTLRWMAPELLGEAPQYSTKSDVYALGMVMWEMAAMCTVPFKNMSNSKVVRVVQNRERERIPDGTPEDYRLWIEQCWQHNPLERPNAKEITLGDDSLSAIWRASLASSILTSTIVCQLECSPENKVFLEHLRPIKGSHLSLSPPEKVKTEQKQHLKRLSRMAECNITGAQVTLAENYENGSDGVTKDERLAFKWYHRAANKGNIEAMRRVADMYSTGKGTEKNGEEATRWYQMASRLQQINVPLEVVSNEIQLQKACNSATLSWLRKTSQKGLASAQRNIGLMYAKGRIVKQSEIEAFSWMRKAAEGGDTIAQYDLACAYLRGSTVEQDDAEAVKWFTMAAY